MAEYIERENLLSEIRNNKLMARKPAAKKIIGIIELLPAADVRPERHGRWEKFSKNTWQCAKCKNLFSAEWWYCPRCGAKMDGKDGESNE